MVNPSPNTTNPNTASRGNTHPQAPNPAFQWVLPTFTVPPPSSAPSSRQSSLHSTPSPQPPRLSSSSNSQSKDSSYTYVQFHSSRNADLFEDFCKDKLPDDEIYVPPNQQPLNPEDEDDVVPDQHAAFGITRAMREKKDVAWKDLGLGELMKRGPGKGQGPQGGGAANGNAASRTGFRSLPR